MPVGHGCVDFLYSMLRSNEQSVSSSKQKTAFEDSEHRPKAVVILTQVKKKKITIILFNCAGKERKKKFILKKTMVILL